MLCCGLGCRLAAKRRRDEQKVTQKSAKLDEYRAKEAEKIAKLKASLGLGAGGFANVPLNFAGAGAGAGGSGSGAGGLDSRFG